MQFCFSFTSPSAAFVFLYSCIRFLYLSVVHVKLASFVSGARKPVRVPLQGSRKTKQKSNEINEIILNISEKEPLKHQKAFARPP